MNEVSLIANLRKPNAQKTVFDSVEWLQKRGVSVAVSLDLAPHVPKGSRSYPENELSRHGEMLLAMGGDGTMARWYAVEPRLVGSDYIHPMPAGAKIVGELLYGSLRDGYNEYKLRQLRNTEGGPESPEVSNQK